MATNMPMSDYSSYAVSPVVHSTVHADFSPYVSVKTEVDLGYSPVHRHGCSNQSLQSLRNNPHGLPSCMFAASLSPCMLTSPSSENCVSMTATKENNGFRSVPSCRRRLDFNHNTFIDIGKVGPVAVAKRNERERNRVKLINMTFQTLRQHLPLGNNGVKGKSRKLSKVQTLRSAIDYIRQLQEMIHTRQFQHQTIDFHSSIDDHKTSVKSSNGDYKASFQVNSIDLSSSQQDDSKGYFMCQKLCAKSSLLKDETSQNVVQSARTQNECNGSSVATNCSVDSPYSDTSSYDTVTTPDDEEYIDFDDWF